MRALQLHAFDGPDSLQLAEVDDPVAGPGEVVVRVHAIGINFPDLLATRGTYQHLPPLPYVPGCEIAGVVEASSPGSQWAPGARVSAFVWSGGFAERAVVPDASIMSLPDDVSFEVGAGLVVNYQTAWFALARRGQVVPGETVLVLGAGGGIGTAALQVARGLGARTIAGVADEAQRATAIAAGADEVVILAAGFSEQVRAATAGRGVDAVVDPLGDWIFAEGVRCLAPLGRILVVGFAAGAIPELRTNRLLLRNVSAVGVAWGAFIDVDPTIVTAGSRALTQMWQDRVLHPSISTVGTFEEIPKLLSLLGAGRIAGKAVIRVAVDA